MRRVSLLVLLRRELLREVLRWPLLGVLGVLLVGLGLLLGALLGRSSRFETQMCVMALSAIVTDSPLLHGWAVQHVLMASLAAVVALLLACSLIIWSPPAVRFSAPRTSVRVFVVTCSASKVLLPVWMHAMRPWAWCAPGGGDAVRC